MYHCISTSQIYYQCPRLVFEEAVILEAKAVAAISPVFIAQTIIYLKVLGNKLGVLINFGEAQMKVKRLVLQLGREQRMEPRMEPRMTRIHG